MKPPDYGMPSWAKGNPFTATKKATYQARKKRLARKVSIIPEGAKKNQIIQLHTTPIPSSSHLKATSPSAPSSHATHPSPKSDSSHHQKPHPPSQRQPSKDHRPVPDPLQSDVCSSPNSTQNYSSQSLPKHYICSKLPNQSELVDPTRNRFLPFPIRLRGGGQIWKRR